jgi:hypothetical protein
MTDRYLKIILTIIALELGWIGFNQTMPPVSAQGNATPVILRGIDLGSPDAYLPVGVVGAYRQVPPSAIPTMDRLTVRVDASAPLNVRTIAPVEIDNRKPIKVENVGYTPGQKPGE